MRVAVTGGSGGIGAATVRHLAGQGHDVLFTYCRGRESAEALQDATGARARHYDQGDPASLAALAALLREEPFDALVNNAARPSPRRLLLKTDPEAFIAYQAEALRGVLTLSSALASQLKARGAPGAIVTVLSSVTLGMPPAKQAAYVSAKYALLGLTRAMAVELVRHGVRVNAVAPSMTATAFNADLPERFVEELAATLPMERLATPAEVAGVIAFLLSPAASYITGVNLPVAGGQAC
ncbi:SDR family oxidoreductase [bacterium]|nr:SDR family oxidoreductase [bacterium]